MAGGGIPPLRLPYGRAQADLDAFGTPPSWAGPGGPRGTGGRGRPPRLPSDIPDHRSRQPEAKNLYLATGYTPLFDLDADPEEIKHLAFTRNLGGDWSRRGVRSRLFARSKCRDLTSGLLPHCQARRGFDPGPVFSPFFSASL